MMRHVVGAIAAIAAVSLAAVAVAVESGFVEAGALLPSQLDVADVRVPVWIAILTLGLVSLLAHLRGLAARGRGRDHVGADTEKPEPARSEPVEHAAQPEPPAASHPEPTPASEPTAEHAPEPTPEPVPEPVAEPAPEPTPEPALRTAPDLVDVTTAPTSNGPRVNHSAPRVDGVVADLALSRLGGTPHPPEPRQDDGNGAHEPRPARRALVVRERHRVRLGR